MGACSLILEVSVNVDTYILHWIILH